MDNKKIKLLLLRIVFLVALVSASGFLFAFIGIKPILAETYYTSTGGILKVILVGDPSYISSWPVTTSVVNSLISSGKAKWVVNDSLPSACQTPPGGVNISDVSGACKTSDTDYSRVKENCTTTLTCSSNGQGQFIFYSTQPVGYMPTWWHNSTYMKMSGNTYRQFGIEIQPGARPAKSFYVYLGVSGGCYRDKDNCDRVWGTTCNSTYYPYFSGCGPEWSSGTCGSDDNRKYKHQRDCYVMTSDRYNTIADWKPENGSYLTMHPPNLWGSDWGSNVRIEQTFNFRVDVNGSYRFSKPRAYQANPTQISIYDSNGTYVGNGFNDTVLSASAPGVYPYQARLVCANPGYCDGKGCRDSICAYALPVSPPYNSERISVSSVVQYAVLIDKNPPTPTPTPTPEVRCADVSIWKSGNMLLPPYKIFIGDDLIFRGGAYSSDLTDTFDKMEFTVYRNSVLNSGPTTVVPSGPYGETGGWWQGDLPYHVSLSGSYSAKVRVHSVKYGWKD